MPTYHEETLEDRYSRENQDYLSVLARMKPEQIQHMEMSLNNALYDVDMLRKDVARLVEALAGECEKLREDAERWRAISQKRELGKKYGCHCDLDEGMEPDGCVIDSGERRNCVYAKTIEVKEQCEYWRVIVTDSAVQEKSK